MEKILNLIRKPEPEPAECDKTMFCEAEQHRYKCYGRANAKWASYLNRKALK